MTGLVVVEHTGDGVAVVTLNRPNKYNALSTSLLTELSDHMRALASDTELRAAVLTGAGAGFCGGVDLVELGEGGRFGPEALDALREFPLPLIGAINGAAVAGGLEVALACDFRIASDRARFADTHARVGGIPGWGLTARLPQAVGQAWARQMSFTGDFVNATTALRIGLVNEVVPHDQLLARARELATAVCGSMPAAVAHIRESYDRGRDGTGADSLGVELSAGDRLLLADATEFLARRGDVFDRGRQQ